MSMSLLRHLRGEGLRAHLLRGASGNLAVAATEKLLALGSSVILARLLGPSGYGVFAFAISVVVLLQIPAEFGMTQLLAREIAAAAATGRWDFARGVLRRGLQFVTLSTAVITCISLAVFCLMPLPLSRESRLTLILAVGFMVTSVYGTFAQAVLQGLRRVVVAKLPMMVGRPALFLAGVVSMWWLYRGRLDPLMAMGTNLGATAAMLVCVITLAARSFHTRCAVVAPTYETRRWLGSALPFAFMGGLAIINSRTDIVMLGLLDNTHDVGIYRVAVAGATLIPLVLGAINGAIGPTLAGLFSTGDRMRLARIVRITAMAGLAGGLLTFTVFAFAGQDLIQLVFGTAYLTAWPPLMILAVGQVSNAGAGPVGLVLNMTGYERDSFFGLLAAAVVNVMLNAALIPSMGTIGAAIATAISTALWNILLSWRVRRRLGFLPFGIRRLTSLQTEIH